MQHIHKLINRITEWRQELQQLCANDDMLFVNCDHVLKVMENGLRHRVGQEVNETSQAAWQPSPITHVMGDAIPEIKPLRTDSAKPSNADIDKLKLEAEEAYATFMDRDSETILENMEQIVIRAVAKKAGMDVTSTEPARITVEFIDLIKQAITNKAAVAAAKESVNGTNDDTRNDIIENYFELFTVAFKEIAAEYGRTDGFTEEETTLIKEMIAKGLDEGMNLDESIEPFKVATRQRFENEKQTQETIAATINEIVELQKATNVAAGKEFTDTDEKELREHFANATIDNMIEVMAEMKVALSKLSETKPANDPAPASTTTTAKKTNGRR